MTQEEPADRSVEPVDVPPSSYAEACEELDEILEALEDGRADVDALTAQVGRARYLLHYCAQRLEGARLEVRDVLDELDAG